MTPWKPHVHPPLWSREGPNLLAPANDELLARAFDAGPVFGRHEHFFGGRSGDNWAFDRLEAFHDYLSSTARPGDRFSVWSVPALVEKGLVLAHGRDTTGGFPSEVDEAEVRGYLERPLTGALYREVALIAASPDSTSPSAFSYRMELFDLDTITEHGEQSFADGFEAALEWMNDDREVWVLPFTEIDSREHMVLDAKYPNVEGEVPLGGAY